MNFSESHKTSDMTTAALTNTIIGTMSTAANTVSVADKALTTLLLLTAATGIGIFGAIAGIWPSIVSTMRLFLMF
jgi:hypothetical protein